MGFFRHDVERVAGSGVADVINPRAVPMIIEVSTLSDIRGEVGIEQRRTLATGLSNARIHKTF